MLEGHLRAAEAIQPSIKTLSHEMLFKPFRRVSADDIARIDARLGNQDLVAFLRDYSENGAAWQARVEVARRAMNEALGILDAAPITPSADMKQPHLHRRRSLFGDCDPGGIIYTPRVSHFVVEASIEFLGARLGGPAERRLFEMGIAPPARSLHLEFLKPMSWDDELEVEVQVQEMRTHAIVLSFVGTVAGERAFQAELTLVCVSTKTLKAVKVPDELRNALAVG